MACTRAVSYTHLDVYKRQELSRRIGFQTELENKLSELERTNAELEQFAYVASHDLQEPLRKIRAFSERLQVRHAPPVSYTHLLVDF